MYFLRRLMFWRRKWWVGRAVGRGVVTIHCRRRSLFEMYDGPFFTAEEAWTQAEMWAKYLRMDVGR